ncbi:membrane protein [Streptomyces albospinus]|uniref:Membrane protein n=1 Tax=Streptomyces albospinus TaxID=285515 RepID=A0ABQ2VPR5_9ACTN|nr:ferritin-like protein [Streptomyces albospinus]GGV04875.1 membrane protein [Streptomyces albospinus]
MATMVRTEPQITTMIRDLLKVEPEKHDLAWIKKSLQAAIALELSTIPPYLCALWSIKKDGTDAGQRIQGIALDEMFHLGLACNMLSAVGGKPDIIAAVPKYPTKLPGNVRNTFDVYLSGLTKDYLRKVFMEIEMPLHPVALAESWETIGVFYDAILTAIKKEKPPIGTGPQMQGTIGRNKLTKFTKLSEIEDAIKVIKEQGEGTGQMPDDPGQDRAHYYKFGEIYYGRKLKQVNGSWKWEGDPVPFPEVYPMAALKDKSGVWPDPRPEAKPLIKNFNAKYSEMLQLLHKAWANGDTKAYGTGIGMMFELGPIAVSLMKISLKGDDKHAYGPEFRYVP